MKDSDTSYVIKYILLKKNGHEKDTHWHHVAYITSCRNMKASITRSPYTHDCQLTVKWGFPGWIFSSFRTQIPFVSFRDWYNMSWPSTFRFAIVYTLFCCIFCTTASVQNKGSVNNYSMCTVLQHRSPSQPETDKFVATCKSEVRTDKHRTWKCKTPISNSKNITNKHSHNPMFLQTKTTTLA